MNCNNIIQIKDITKIALLTSLTAILSQIALPLPFTPIPINLALISVFLSGALLGSKKGFISQMIYLLLGMLGLPIFAKFTGGIGALIGPTGGFLMSYAMIPIITGVARGKFMKSIIAMSVGLLICYALGTGWFVFITGNSVLSALTMCVLPFIVGDIVKIVISAIVANRICKISHII